MRPNRIFWHRTSRGGMTPTYAAAVTLRSSSPHSIQSSCSSSSLSLLANLASGFCSPLTHSTKKPEVLLLPPAAGQCRPTRTAQNIKIGSLNVTMALRLVTSRVAASASSRSLAVAVRSTNGAFVWWKLSCVVFFFCTSRAQFPDLLSVYVFFFGIFLSHQFP